MLPKCNKNYQYLLFESYKSRAIYFSILSKIIILLQHLVGPLGFSLDESKVKRAGLDYWEHVDLRQYKGKPVNHASCCIHF